MQPKDPQREYSDDLRFGSGAGHLGVPLLQRLPQRHYTQRQLVLIDLLIVAAIGLIAAVFLPQHAPAHNSGIKTTAAWSAYIPAGLLVLPRRRYPRVTIWLVLPFVLAGIALGIGGPGPFFVVMTLYSAVLASPGLLGIVTAVMVAGALIPAIVAGGGGQIINNCTGAVILMTAGWLAAEYTRASQSYRAQQAERERERAAAREAGQAHEVQRAVDEERVKIARELHDIVAHGMSVIAVRSGVARLVLDSQPQEARKALDIIEKTSKRSLREMRMLVGVLRADPAEDAGLTPAPTLGDVTTLVEQIGCAGIDIEMRVLGCPPAEPPSALGLSVYRILQEALTNVVRHAGPTRARVSIEYLSHAIDLEIIDAGPARSGPAGPAARRAGGHGLIGMRERAALFGGSVTAGPTGAGFRVYAHLPLTGQRPPPGPGPTGDASARADAALSVAATWPDKDGDADDDPRADRR